MKKFFGNILLSAAFLLMLSSCMMADEEVFTDPFGHVGLSVRGYVYFRPDEPAASQSVSVHVYDRSDYGFASPLAVADEVSAYDGYYEADMSFVLTGDILIKVFPEDKTGGRSLMSQPFIRGLTSSMTMIKGHISAICRLSIWIPVFNNLRRRTVLALCRFRAAI